MTGYGQFCPVSLAAEILTRRWTPLVIRELLCGSTRFNELRRGLPKMSPSLLSKRLDELADAGIVVRTGAPDAAHDEYRLTTAGHDVLPVIEAMGRWGRRWIGGGFREEDLDPDLLMWDIRRRVDTGSAPAGRVVVRFTFADLPTDAHRDYWIVVDAQREVDLCWRDPGYPVDLGVDSSVRTMTDIWMGRMPFREALRRGEITLHGPTELRRSFPEWLGRSLFAAVPEAEAGVAPRPGS